MEEHLKEKNMAMVIITMMIMMSHIQNRKTNVKVNSDDDENDKRDPNTL